MSNVTTQWSARDGSGPQTITESHMLKPGEIGYFRKPGVSIINLGAREAGVFLLGKGDITAEVPIARSVMSKTDADWIARRVLPKTYLKSCGGLARVRSCSCHYGPCGHCIAGRHHECSTRKTGKPVVQVLAHIVTTSGAALTPVRATGEPCRWFCPCPTCAGQTTDRPERPAPIRRARGDLRPGDTVWLVPRTLGCLAICWKQPRVTVVSTAGHYVIVQVDGVEHRIHIDNVRRSDPGADKPSAPARVKARPTLPEGFTEVPLF